MSSIFFLIYPYISIITKYIYIYKYFIAIFTVLEYNSVVTSFYSVVQTVLCVYLYTCIFVSLHSRRPSL